LKVVSAEVPRAVSDALLDALAEQGQSPAAWDDVERNVSRIDLYRTDDAAAAAASRALTDAGAAFGLSLRPVVTPLPEQDWAESWKRFFHVLRVSDRVVIRPTWEPYAAAPGECVVTLDPGMSFGTGSHGTTRACLVYLDRLAAEDADRRVLDMGCGSGILAIAARKLGFREVSGFDVDPDAVDIARENAGANGVTVRFDPCDLAQNTRQAEVVVANILAPVLIGFADSVAAAVAPGGCGALVLSGILDTQYADVRAAYEARGFVEVSSLPIDAWRSGLFARPAGSTGKRGTRNP
jgi:ribosomal protein L11 methyltransferase